MGSRRKSGAKREGDGRSATAAPREFSSPTCYLHEFAGVDVQSGFALKRIQEPPSTADGHRVLVDRLWPRGISKARAALDEWCVDVAPSTALRKWYHANLSRWSEFRRRYRAELRAHAAALQPLRARAARQRVTLLYAAHDTQRNHALVLREVLEGQPRAVPRRARTSQT